MLEFLFLHNVLDSDVMADSLDFEAPLVALQKEIEALTGYPDDEEKTAEITRLTEKLTQKRHEIYSGLSPMQKVLGARHPLRPYFLDYVDLLFDDFMEIHIRLCA